MQSNQFSLPQQGDRNARQDPQNTNPDLPNLIPMLVRINYTQ